MPYQWPAPPAAGRPQDCAPSLQSAWAQKECSASYFAACAGAPRKASAARERVSVRIMVLLLLRRGSGRDAEDGAAAVPGAGAEVADHRAVGTQRERAERSHADLGAA